MGVLRLAAVLAVTLLVISAVHGQDVEERLRNLMLETRENGNRFLIAGFVRLSFHDCMGENGCDGCVDLNHVENRGLSRYTRVLEEFERETPTGLTKADLWAKAAWEAAKLSTQISNCNLPEDSDPAGCALDVADEPSRPTPGPAGPRPSTPGPSTPGPGGPRPDGPRPSGSPPGPGGSPPGPGGSPPGPGGSPPGPGGSPPGPGGSPPGPGGSPPGPGGSPPGPGGSPPGPGGSPPGPGGPRPGGRGRRRSRRQAPPPACDISTTLPVGLEVGEFIPGRSTSETCSAEDSQFPRADINTGHLTDFFLSNFGFDERETVCIMGAHSLGQMCPSNSGFSGPWTANRNTLSNSYYDEVFRGWRTEQVDSTGKWQWRGPAITRMLNADMALRQNFVVDATTGKPICGLASEAEGIDVNDCGSPAIGSVRDIARNFRTTGRPTNGEPNTNIAFLNCFFGAFKKMLEKGLRTQV